MKITSKKKNDKSMKHIGYVFFLCNFQSVFMRACFVFLLNLVIYLFKLMTLFFFSFINHINFFFCLFIVTFYSTLVFCFVCMYFACIIWFFSNNCRILNSCLYCRLSIILLFDLVELFLSV